MNATTNKFWTHESVKPFASAGDPVAAMVERTNAAILDAVEHGWSGPPFDTFELADILGITVIPCESIRDARLVPLRGNHYRIEYNPVQPQARIRFSIAHEIAHTFFPDCREQIRHRTVRHEMTRDDWQLEMLCNLAASELLMPLGSFPEIGNAEFSIDHLLRLRESFQVSTEAVLLRFLKLSRIPCAVFVASRQSDGPDNLQIDYLRRANGWDVPFRSGWEISANSVVNQCGSIGHTAKGVESWDSDVGAMRVECVAIPSYPGADNPRIVGMLSPVKAKQMSCPTIQYLVGDATSPRGADERIIAHVVNDKTPRWGGGFARVVRNHWRDAQDDFVSWVERDRSRLRLGQHHFYRVEDGLSLFHMVAQHGYRPSSRPSIRYHHLESCLLALSEVAQENGASVHMPRIGCGQAGGNWAIVSEMIGDILCRTGIEVTVYDLPSQRSHWE